MFSPTPGVPLCVGYWQSSAQAWAVAASPALQVSGGSMGIAMGSTSCRTVSWAVTICDCSAAVNWPAAGDAPDRVSTARASLRERRSRRVADAGTRSGMPMTRSVDATFRHSPARSRATGPAPAGGRRAHAIGGPSPRPVPPAASRALGPPWAGDAPGLEAVREDHGAGGGGRETRWVGARHGGDVGCHLGWNTPGLDSIRVARAEVERDIREAAAHQVAVAHDRAAARARRPGEAGGAAVA